MQKKTIAITIIIILILPTIGHITYYNLIEDDKYDIVYEFPLNLEGVHSFDKIKNELSMNNNHMKILGNNGIVVIRNFGKYDEFANIYKVLKEKEIPIFIAGDAVLHGFHVIYDESLSKLEEKYLKNELESLTLLLLNATLEQAEKTNGNIQNLSSLNSAYLYLGYKLLNPDENFLNHTVLNNTKKIVEEELQLIENHEGIYNSLIFHGANIDYSRFNPRGHYDRTEELKKYFKAMTWFNLATFHFEIYNESVFYGDVNSETKRAILLVDAFEEVGEDAKNIWNEINDDTEYFVGFSDDLTWLDVLPLVNKHYPNINENYTVLENNETLKKFLKETESLKIPKISKETKGRGLQLFGERYVPDGYIMDYLTDYPDRLTASGLDVMAILGSETADTLLEGEKERVDWYSERQNILKTEFETNGEETWEQNLYWSWLDCLRYNMESAGKVNGAPAFMRSEAWKHKALNTNLASWTELRHDTILYAEQYCPPCSIEPEYKGQGYVEPLPDLYDELQSLGKKMKEILEGKIKVDRYSYDEGFKFIRAITSLISTCERLSKISNLELNNKPISDDDVRFIRNFESRMLNICGEENSESKKTVLVADVGTDPNSNTCLEEGTGYLDIAVVAFPRPDGGVYSAAGPVFSYYEFTQPIDNRLADSSWREMLDNSPPERPEWVSIYAP